MTQSKLFERDVWRFFHEQDQHRAGLTLQQRATDDWLHIKVQDIQCMRLYEVEARLYHIAH